MKLKLRKIGNSIGITFPKEILDKLQVNEGEELYLTETLDGVELSVWNPEFQQVMEAAEVVTCGHFNCMNELAKF